MKEIKAIIQPFMLDKVLDALHEIENLPGCTVSTVQGFGRIGSKDTTADERAYEASERVKLEIVVPDGLENTVTEVIQRNAHTGNRGDGKIFVSDLNNAVAIKTGARGESAI